jgi:sarcosine oxidase delta subunit
MKHTCHFLKIRNDQYHLEEIERVGTKWILHNELKANEKWVYDGEAKQIEQVIHNHIIIINFCPYCGEKLNQVEKAYHTDLHKQHTPDPEFSELFPECFFQCPETEAYNTNTIEKWLVIKDEEGIWLLEKHIPATKEMVEIKEADHIGELRFLSGFDILFCPFCGELLDVERANQDFSRYKGPK